jgi:hypothetical protein
VTPDKIVAVIGIAMSLVLVLANSRLRQQPIGARLWMGAAWAAIIVVAAVAFARFRR